MTEPLSVIPTRGDIPLGYTRLRRGACVDIDAWTASFIESRILMRVAAVALAARHPPVNSHSAAAALHSLPLLGLRDSRCHTIERSRDPQKTRTDVVRHKVPLDDSDITAVGNHLATTLERTAYDTARMLPLDGAVALMDAAMRRAAWDPETKTYSIDAAEAFRARMTARIRAGAGARGIKQLRFVVEFADGRAESPGESQSRLRMWELSLPAPELQVPIMTDDGVKRPDFAWPRLRRFGEFDGLIKLTDPVMMRGRSVDQIVREQQERRAAIERATGWTGMHWGSAEARDADALMASFVAQDWPPHARVGFRPSEGSSGTRN